MVINWEEVWMLMGFYDGFTNKLITIQNIY